VREFSVRFVRSARKEIERLDATVVERVFSRIEALTMEPRPSGCKKLCGAIALGLAVPRNYEGRVLRGAFDRVNSRSTVFA